MGQDQNESKDTSEYNLKVIQQWKKDLENQESLIRARIKFAYNIYRRTGQRSEPLIKELFEESVLTQIHVSKSLLSRNCISLTNFLRVGLLRLRHPHNFVIGRNLELTFGNPLA